jgi:hypothetical protein
MVHLLLAAAFTEGDWMKPSGINALSSAVITHAICAFMERYAGWFMNCKQV